MALNSEQSASIQYTSGGKITHPRVEPSVPTHIPVYSIDPRSQCMVSGMMALHVRPPSSTGATFAIFGRKCQRISISKGPGPFTTVATCREDTMTKYAIPWVLRSRARCDSLCRDVRLMPIKLSTRIASSTIVAARFVVEHSTQIFAKTGQGQSYWWFRISRCSGCWVEVGYINLARWKKLSISSEQPDRFSNDLPICHLPTIESAKWKNPTARRDFTTSG